MRERAYEAMALLVPEHRSGRQATNRLSGMRSTRNPFQAARLPLRVYRQEPPQLKTMACFIKSATSLLVAPDLASLQCPSISLLTLLCSRIVAVPSLP